MTVYSAGALVADIVFLAAMAGVVAAIIFLVRAKSKPAGQTPTAPDWYPDPDDPTLLRYFDGHSWTAATRPPDAPQGR